MTKTQQQINEINMFFRLNPELIIKTGGLLSSPTTSYRGFTFDEYDNGNCYSRLPWVHYFRIKKGNSILNCQTYEVWINRIHKIITK